MSIVHQVFCWRFEMTGLKKIVLLYLAGAAKRESEEASLSVSEVATECGVSESTVRKSYASLVKDGHLMVLSKPRGTLHYRVTVDIKTEAPHG